jgi:hypothetical protein
MYFYKKDQESTSIKHDQYHLVSINTRNRVAEAIDFFVKLTELKDLFNLSHYSIWLKHYTLYKYIIKIPLYI